MQVRGFQHVEMKDNSKRRPWVFDRQKDTQDNVKEGHSPNDVNVLLERCFAHTKPDHVVVGF